MELHNFQFNQKIEQSLALKLELPELTSGLQIIRNEKGWRENEKLIEYIWVARVSRSFVGFGGLITVKFTEHNFREYLNPTELLQGIFLTPNGGEVEEFYFEKENQDFYDGLYNIKNLELFTANTGLALDGVGYEYHIIANNIDTRISVNNPTSNYWKDWETGIRDLGKRLSLKSGNREMIGLFE